MLEVIAREKLQDNARDTGAMLRQGLKDLSARWEAIGAVRGAGFFIGVEIVADRDRKTPDGALATRIVNGLRKRRVLISSAGPDANVLKIRPPLPFDVNNARTLLEKLDETLKDVG